MRMWCVPASMLCRQHLLAEHNELHMIIGAIHHKKNIDGYLKGGLIDLSKIGQRHVELVIEMQKRGYSHKSPLQCGRMKGGYVDISANIQELMKRCPECSKRIEDYKSER